MFRCFFKLLFFPFMLLLWFFRLFFWLFVIPVTLLMGIIFGDR